MGLKIVSVNIEWDRHLPAVKAFLEKEKPEIICLMEACREDLDFLIPDYPHRLFKANFRLENGRAAGVVVASKFRIKGEAFYCDDREEAYLPGNDERVGAHRPVVVIASWEAEGREWKIGATHFTWTKGGLPTKEQEADIGRLLQRLDGQELVLGGDFNLPRKENDLYRVIAAKYRDNIPPEVTTTVDPDLHRANKEQKGQLALMVDYLWSTPAYQVESVRVECGVSDHCAVVGEISLV